MCDPRIKCRVEGAGDDNGSLLNYIRGPSAINHSMWLVTGHHRIAALGLVKTSVRDCKENRGEVSNMLKHAIYSKFGCSVEL